MNIVFITTSFFLNKDCVERHVAELSRVLRAHGPRLDVLTPIANGGRRREQHDALDNRRFRARPSFTAWFSLWRFCNVIRDADSSHLHDFPMSVWAWPYLLLFHKKFFVTSHGWEGVVPPNPTIAQLRQFIERQSAGSIAIGHFIGRWYGQHPTLVLYGGHGRHGERRADPTLPPASGGTHFLFLGRLARDTNVMDALAFFSHVHSEDPAARFTVLEDGSMREARLILTDSGGIQEEACILKVPCITLRENTERPETIDVGANVLVGTDAQRLERAVSHFASIAPAWDNPFGDGHSAERMIDIATEHVT